MSRTCSFAKQEQAKNVIDAKKREIENMEIYVSMCVWLGSEMYINKMANNGEIQRP